MLCLSESFLSKIPERRLRIFLSGVVFPKPFRPKVFDLNVVIFVMGGGDNWRTAYL